MAYGHSKDQRPDLAQIKLMMVTLDPLAMPLVTQILPSNTADDGLYVPAIAATQATLDKRGMLHVGDSKMESLHTRAHYAATGDYYLHPLSMKGKQGELRQQWVNHILSPNAQQCCWATPQHTLPYPTCGGACPNHQAPQRQKAAIG